ncbi:MAG: hypothetical protein KC505_03215 [Myxococcales bacterium]|nr:hypothetical protein [Myxococcales bacterium]USN50098.1 MAG: hypothetical protein H6731_07445 [Myxococcales bacterium]
MNRLLSLFFSTILVVFSASSLNSQSFSTADAQKLILVERHADFYWGQSWVGSALNFVQNGAKYTYHLGNYTVDISKRTYESIKSLPGTFSKDDFNGLAGEIYSLVADQVADHAIDVLLGTFVSTLTGLDPAGAGLVLDEAAKFLAGELADKMGVKELPANVSTKLYKFVKSYKK